MTEVNCECAITLNKDCPWCAGFKKDDVDVGDPIIYVPPHALNDDGSADLAHKDLQWGFVTSMNDEFVFCRYFTAHNDLRLRTTCNSEATSPQNIYKLQGMPPGAAANIKLLMEELGYDAGEDA